MGFSSAPSPELTAARAEAEQCRTIAEARSRGDWHWVRRTVHTAAPAAAARSLARGGWPRRGARGRLSRAGAGWTLARNVRSSAARAARCATAVRRGGKTEVPRRPHSQPSIQEDAEFWEWIERFNIHNVCVAEHEGLLGTRDDWQRIIGFLGESDILVRATSAAARFPPAAAHPACAPATALTAKP